MASRGRLFSSGVITFAFSDGIIRFEGTWRRPARIDVGEIQRIELRPQNVTFGPQGCMGLVLFLSGAGVLHHPGESEVSVFRCLRKASSEVVEAAGEPGIIHAKCIY